MKIFNKISNLFSKKSTRIVALVGALTLTTSIISSALQVSDVSSRLTFMHISHPKYIGDSLATYMQKTDDGRLAYCLDFTKGSPTDELAQGSQLNDAYYRVLKNGYPYVSFTGDANQDYYITQTAVWLTRGYLDGYEVGFAPDHLLAYNDHEQMLKNHAVNLFNKAINSSSAPAPTISVTPSTVTAEKKDGKFVAGPFTVTGNPNNDLNYWVTTQSENIIVRSVNGDARTDFHTGDSFYIEIPLNIDMSEVKFRVDADIPYEAPRAYITSMAGKQNIVVLENFTANAVSTSGTITYDLNGDIKLVKKGDDGKLLQGVKFTLKDNNGTVVGNYETDANGELYITGIKAGNYILEETETAEGYVIINPNTDIVVVPQETTSVEVTNKQIKGKIDIMKVDNKFGKDKPLKNAEFTIWDMDGVEVDKLITDIDGKAVSKDLPYGKYTMKETKSPLGYKPQEKTYNVEISEDGKTYEYVIDNTIQTGKVSVTKVDSENNKKKLAGAEFTIYDLHRNVVDVLTTDENGKATSKAIDFGRYIMQETKAPEGYVLDETIYEVNITKDEILLEYTVENTSIYGDLEITKSDIADGKLLPNTEFTIRDESGKVVVKGITDENGLAKFKLKYGKYTYQETNAPEGYVIDESEFPFEIKEDGEIIKAEMTNEMIKGKVGVTKVDADNKDIVLQGAEFTIYDEEGNIVEVLVTDESGKAYSKDLNYGKYTMKETKAPEGYVLSDKETKIVVDEHEKVYEYTIKNRKPIINTGGTPVALAVAGGLTLTTIAGTVLFKKKRKK
ncbi:MAG: SpaA isopeptide-forming pilin-related protein [Clostridium sp.]